MTTSLLGIGYTYSKRRLKKPPEISGKIINLVGRISTWNTSRIYCTLTIQGRGHYLNRLNHSILLMGTEKLEIPAAFDKYKR